MTETNVMEAFANPIVQKLTKDIKAGVTTMTKDEARYLVDTYYQLQKYRIKFDNQIRAQKDEPHETLSWFAKQVGELEETIKKALHIYAKANPVGEWALSICGIGPVIAAGLLAHIDVNKASTFGDVQRFAGIDPTSVWEKGKKRPFNADLKRLTYIIGESFIKVQNLDSDFYGKIYAKRKLLEISRNDAGLFADQAAAKLKKFNIGKDTDAYKAYSSGKLPPAHIHARARRYAVRLFLAHFFEVAYQLQLGKLPPVPYAIDKLGHSRDSYIAPPNFVSPIQ